MPPPQIFRSRRWIAKEAPQVEYQSQNANERRSYTARAVLWFKALISNTHPIRLALKTMSAMLSCPDSPLCEGHISIPRHKPRIGWV